MYTVPYGMVWVQENAPVLSTWHSFFPSKHAQMCTVSLSTHFANVPISSFPDNKMYTNMGFGEIALLTALSS